MKNTKEKGTMHFVSFVENGVYYGVCLDFNIIVNGSSSEEVINSVRKISHDHLATVVKNNLDDSLLNRHAPKEYWDMYERLVAKKVATVSLSSKKPIVSSYFAQVYPTLAIA